MELQRCLLSLGYWSCELKRTLCHSDLLTSEKVCNFLFLRKKKRKGIFSSHIERPSEHPRALLRNCWWRKQKSIKTLQTYYTLRGRSVLLEWFWFTKLNPSHLNHSVWSVGYMNQSLPLCFQVTSWTKAGFWVVWGDSICLLCLASFQLVSLFWPSIPSFLCSSHACWPYYLVEYKWMLG